MKKRRIIKAAGCLSFFLTVSLISRAQGTMEGPAQVSPQGPDWDHLPVISRPSFPKDTFSILRYGATGDGLTLNTDAINTAIEQCSKGGGGVVLIPAGYWLTGPITLRSGVNLHLDQGAMLQFSGDRLQYPLVAGNFEGHPAVRCQSPISGDGLSNIAITGRGIIDGNGEVWRMASKEKFTETEWRQLLASGGVLSDDGRTWYPSEGSYKGSKMKNAGVLAPGQEPADFGEIRDFLRPNLLVLSRCHRVLLQGVTFQNSGAWCLHPLICEDLTLEEVHVRNPWNAQNGDGVDIESCKNVLVENSTFDAGDDGICLKSGRDEEGRKRGIPTENVIVRNNVVYRAHGGLVIGSEMSGGVKNVFASNCVFIGTDIGLRFKTVRGRGGVVERIFIRDIRMKDIVHQAILLDMYYFAKAHTLAQSGGKPDPAGIPQVTEATPQFRDIHISGVVCDGAEEGLFIRGLPEMNIRDISLDHIFLKAKQGGEIIAARNISLADIQWVTSASAPLVYIENSRDLQFNAIRYNTVSTALFSINGDQCGNIRLSGTTLNKSIPEAKFDYGAARNMLEIK